jgi:predicted Zn-dependent protease
MSATTQWVRPDRSVLILATWLIALVAVVSLVPASPAQAHPEDAHVWNTSTVCVESHVGKEWGVKGAIRRWNHLDGGPTFVLEQSCAAYDGTVTVRYENSDSKYTGWSKWYWDAEGHIVHADVTVNALRIKSFATQDQSCQRKHTTAHEFGHALGLRHYTHSHAGSVMSYLGWKRLCGGLSAHDAADYHELYPAPAA